MRIYLFLILSISIWGCSTVEVTKEVIKATNSVKNTIEEALPEKKTDEVEVEVNLTENIEIEKEIIQEKQEVEKNIVKNQQKLAEINFIGSTENKIVNLIGKADLSRIDGSSYTLRYNSDNCRLFLFFNNNAKIKRVEHFELRNTLGKLLNSKQSLEQCYREFNLIS